MDLSLKWDFKLDFSNHFMEFKMRGFWDDAEADAFCVAFCKHVDELSEGGKRGFKVLIDAIDFPAQNESVRGRILKNMSYSVNNGLEKSARIVSRSITELQFRTLAKEVSSNLKAKNAQFGEFNSRAEALKWLELPGIQPPIPS
jgi:hypothetical protein